MKLISKNGEIGVYDEEELKAIILLQMKSIVDDVVEEILESLKKNIDRKVYNSFSPTSYQRLGDNGGLKDLWENTEAEIKNGKVIGKVKEDPERLTLNKDLFQHGSNFWEKDDGDIRKFLAEIVIKGESGDLFGKGKWRKPRNFWNPLINKLDSGQVNKLIEKAFKKRKIKFIRIY